MAQALSSEQLLWKICIDFFCADIRQPTYVYKMAKIEIQVLYSVNFIEQS